MLNLTHKSNADYTEIAFLTEKIGEISSLTPYSLDKAMEEIHLPICWGGMQNSPVLIFVRGIGSTLYNCIRIYSLI